MDRLSQQKHFLWLLAISVIMLSPRASAQDSLYDRKETLPTDYPDDYIFAQMTRDKPAQPNKDELRAGRLSYGVSYSRHFGDYWIAGMGYRVKSFIRKDDQALSLLTFSNHTRRIFRLYHPLYALIGTEWAYVIPTSRISLPLVKDPDYSTDISVGLSTSLWLFITPHFPLEFHVLRWRGTKTNRLHGWESTLSLGYSY